MGWLERGNKCSRIVTSSKSELRLRWRGAQFNDLHLINLLINIEDYALFVQLVDSQRHWWARSYTLRNMFITIKEKHAHSMVLYIVSDQMEYVSKK